MSEMIPRSVQIGDAVIFQKLQQEIVVLNMESQQYYGLDPMGASIWELLLEHGNVGTVANRLHQAYEVDEKTVNTDLEALVRDLVAAGLLKPA